MEQTAHLLTPSSLKALAHPIRVKLLGLLRTEGPSTATALAAKIGESSGSTSYHLRQLAAADFVTDDPERGNGRERWWRAAQDSTRLEDAAWQDEPEMRPVVDAYMQAVLQGNVDRARNWLTRWPAAPKRWRSQATFSDMQLDLSPKELGRLNEEIEQLLNSYRRPARKGDAKVTVQWQSFPLGEVR